VSKYNIPENTEANIRRYVNYRIDPGDFLKAVLTNDLFEAYNRADEDNIVAMFFIVRFIFNQVPRCCWGEKETVRDWMNGDRDNGLPMRDEKDIPPFS
jgi:hypothetical protein